jgi:hypothetical protein
VGWLSVAMQWRGSKLGNYSVDAPIEEQLQVTRVTSAENSCSLSLICFVECKVGGASARGPHVWFLRIIFSCNLFFPLHRVFREGLLQTHSTLLYAHQAGPLLQKAKTLASETPRVVFPESASNMRA